jgi:hypothetical protein
LMGLLRKGVRGEFCGRMKLDWGGEGRDAA